MKQGSVKWFNETKGYGFIVPKDGVDDVFVHYTQVSMDGFKTLADSHLVQFEIIDAPKGQQAHNVIRA